MAPKRRKAPDQLLAQESTKRVTRLSTKADASKDKEITTKASQAEPKGDSKAKRKAPSDNKTATNANPSQAKKAKGKAKADTTTHTTTTTQTPSSNVQTLTITSPLVKNPIQCETYTPPSSSSSASSNQTLIFTHGAGGTLSAPAMVNFCTGFSSHFAVLAFQGSMNLAARVAGFHACLEHIGLGGDGGEIEGKGPKEKKKVVLGGRSMGARAAVVTANEMLMRRKNKGKDKSKGKSKGKDKDTGEDNVDVDADSNAQIHLILASYPLKGPKGDLRDKILLDLSSEIIVLFISGDRDNMCPLDELESVRGKMKAKSQLVLVKGADHGMHVKPAKKEREVGQETGRLAAEWVDGRVEEDLVYVGS